MKEGFLYVANMIFPTLLALSSEEQERGLMFQKEPPIMSFVYAHPRINQFWMKNTPAPLDIVFAKNNKISQICKGEPYSLKAIGNHSLSDLVVEFPYGTMEKSGITLGDSLGLFMPSLAELVDHRNHGGKR